ncbi:chorismate-binding protein [uncultured Muribaculum sp.]|uniref:chorismate-binding protein n=1 Tax=uncultured Muribaculum sp. TaxID=1918613 RepID=UPI0025EDE520|nr:chorismate-binding protein [uncultured Muribaculum sp.]
MPDKLIASVDDALRRRVAAVLYAMPGCGERYRFFEARDGGPLRDEEADFGFFYAPFAVGPDAGFPRLLQPCTEGDVLSAAKVADIVLPASTCMTEYRECVSMIAERHASYGGGKTVYSRRISDQHSVVGWGRTAFDYFGHFPDTFRFLFTTPDCGCWLGASPELLLRRDAGDSILTTMALAGTLRDDSAGWDAKNIEEHDYVTRFIVDTLADFSIKAEVAPAGEVRFGSIRHLCHRITARYSGPIVPLLNALSPTPALSGFPRDEALRLIGEVESPRGLYGGYVGVNSPEGIRAFVNLRSVCFNPGGGYCAYAGGGITALSDASDEWLETEAKSAVLRRCISANCLSKTSDL